MHEMALAEGVLQIVEDTMRGQSDGRITAVWLEIGELSTVEPSAMQFCFEAVVKGSVADGARLEIDRIPGQAWCHDCGKTVHVAHLIAPCPFCGGFKLQVTGGEDMRVKEMEMA
jgi:hydrogenase nickel incorporation protein HypA/HybF